MAFDATTQIFAYMDKVTNEFVASNLQTIITTVTPLVALGLTIALMVEGIFIMARPNGEPLTYLVQKFVRYAIIISVASAGGWYQTSLANVAMRTPDEFASVLIVDGQQGNQEGHIASTIDKALDRGLTTAQRAFDNASVWSGPGLASFALGVTALLCTVLMCGLGAGFILMAKFLLGVAVCFGPIFIFCLLFESTRALFTKWIGTIINYGLVTVLLSAVFGLMMAFYEKAIEAASKANPDSPILVPIVTCGLITVVSWFVLKRVPDMAERWGDGISARIGGFGGWGGGSSAGGGGGGGGGDGGGGGAGEVAGAAAGSAAGPAGTVAGAAAGSAAGAVGNEAGEMGGAMTGMARGSRR
ncbi:type IV secretion system protein (plasmid) [Xanthomonas hortorum pv. pelargonii]|uniref:type IV secretion system protein n=1 Tax=Xanthomonas hortorum TaxID=56454 RepID=UPI00232F703E|nr:type IV secretion system protein [Xanthomonas hortorum]WCI07398.1 type IV secretion system protein [Xanthomonas hortorum pv. pelargonii]